MADDFVKFDVIWAQICHNAFCRYIQEVRHEIQTRSMRRVQKWFRRSVIFQKRRLKRQRHFQWITDCFGHSNLRFAWKAAGKASRGWKRRCTNTVYLLGLEYAAWYWKSLQVVRVSLKSEHWRKLQMRITCRSKKKKHTRNTRTDWSRLSQKEKKTLNSPAGT